MIAGGVRGAGGPALGRHLASAAKNEAVLPLDGRGLTATGIRDQVAELTRLGAHARTRAPLYHVHADPPADRPWTPDERASYWQAFEAEFSLEDRPFAAVAHVKDGRPHEHRVYLRVRADGTAVRLDHDHARREKVGRTFEFSRGEALTPGAHSRAVLAALDREGRGDVAQAMRAAGLDTMPRPRASSTPRERAQAERTATDPAAIAAAALAAWGASDGAEAFAAALAERGLRLARGDKVAVLVDASGVAHPLGRLLGKESKTAGDRIGAADVRARLSGLDLPLVDQVSALPRAAPGAAPPSALPDDITPPTTPGGHHASTSPDDPAPAETPGVVGRADRRLDGGHDAGRDDPGRDAHQGLPGPGSDVVCGAPDSAAHGGPHPAPGSPGPPGEGGADPARPGRRAFGGHRGGAAAARDADGRHRVQARRVIKGLAAAAAPREARLADLTEALRRPPTATGLLAAALTASDDRAAQVLAEEPWRDPRMRSARLIAGDMHEARMAVSYGTDLRAQVARAEADAAQGRVGFLDRLAGFLGVRTAAVRDVDEAEARAAQAEAACDGGRELREDLAQIDGCARGVARGREAERETWSRRPEVAAARREMRGNDLVRAAVAADDFRIGHLAVADLPAAREAVLRREAERLTEIQRQQHDRRTVVTAPAMRLVPAPGGPRR